MQARRQNSEIGAWIKLMKYCRFSDEKAGEGLMKLAVVALQSSRPYRRGDPIPELGDGWVSLNDVDSGASFYASFRRGIEPLPVIGLPKKTWRDRLYSIKQWIADFILGPDRGIVPWRSRFTR